MRKGKTYREDIPNRKNVIIRNEYWLFVNWIATPAPFREPKTQQELAKILKVHKTTFSIWKRIEGFLNDIQTQINSSNTIKHLADIVEGLATKAINGDVNAAALWLECVLGWKYKQSKYGKWKRRKLSSSKNLSDLVKNFKDKSV